MNEHDPTRNPRSGASPDNEGGPENQEPREAGASLDSPETSSEDAVSDTRSPKEYPTAADFGRLCAPPPNVPPGCAGDAPAEPSPVKPLANPAPERTDPPEISAQPAPDDAWTRLGGQGTSAGSPATGNMDWDGKPLEEESSGPADREADAAPAEPEAAPRSKKGKPSGRKEKPAGETASPKPAKAPKPPKPPKATIPPPFDGKRLGPLLRSEALLPGPDGSLAPVQPTVASRIYTALALFPLLPLLLILAAQVLFTLDVRDLWYSDEVRYANAFQNMVGGGHWVVLHLDDVVYPDKPPLYFWFLAALQKIPGLDLLPGAATLPGLFFFGSAISGLLCLLAAYAMARLMGRLDRKGSLAAGIILLSGFFFSGLLHYLRMDLLFTALITLSHVLLFHALVRQQTYGLTILAFLAAGAATLTKGPLGLVLPLLAGLFFITWQGRFRRLFRLDILLGLLLGLAVPAAWLYFAWQAEGQAFIDNILNQQIVARALNTWHHPQPWYYYCISLPLIWLPWTPLLLFLPWNRVFKRETAAAVKTSRTPAAAGLAYLWCALLSGLILLSAISIKLPVYCLPLFPPLAALTARALLRMRPQASRCMQWTLAIVLFLLALTLLIVPFFPGLVPLPAMPEGLYIAGGVALVAACMMAFLPNPRRPEGMLLVIALFAAGFAYPVWSIGAPGLDRFMSPKAQAEHIRSLRNMGYYAASYKVYGGTYSYYAGTVHECKTWEEVQAAIAEHPKMALALRASFWDEMPDKPEGFAEVDRRRIAERDYVLLARPAPEPQNPAPAAEESPAPAPATPAPEARPEQPQAAEEPQSAPGGDVPEAPIPSPAGEPAEENPAQPAAPVEPAVEPPAEPAAPDGSAAANETTTPAEAQPETPIPAEAPETAPAGGAEAPAVSGEPGTPDAAPAEDPAPLAPEHPASGTDQAAQG